MGMSNVERKRVVFAGDCEECRLCGEPVCHQCGEHYAECPCPGPHCEDDGWVIEELGGELWATRACDESAG